MKIDAVYLLVIPVFFALTKFNHSTEAPLRSLTTVEDLWQEDPQYMRKVMRALDPEIPELKPVTTYLEKGDTISAGHALVNYFRQVKRGWIFETLDHVPYEDAVAAATGITEDYILFNNESSKIPRTTGGGWEWQYTGLEGDDEFGYTLNGHKYLLALLTACKDQEHPDFVKTYDRIMQDWVIHHPLPKADDSIYIVLDPMIKLDWRDIGEVEWRTLETGNRLGVTWPQGFFIFQQQEAFSPATRLLMLASIIDQAEYLRKYHKRGHNWTTMEMNGLALAGLAFPEFKKSETWADYAMEVMTQEINRQVYPDGVQTELAGKTQWVALFRFETIAANFERAGRSVKKEFKKRIEEMYDFMAYSVRPDGHQPINSDSDREDLRERILGGAKTFQRSDWEYICSNGEKGNPPTVGPTVVYPWAGIHVMRSGWDTKAHWSFFDAGPYGTGHQHRDKLHLSIAAYGKDLLVDGGRYTHKDYFSFDPTIWRGYFRSSFSHNVILVDGQGQKENELVAQYPLEDKKDYSHHIDYDFAQGTFDSGFTDVDGKISHSRSVLYLHDNYWLVLDHVDTDRPRKLEVLWHFAPTCNVEVDGLEAFSNNDSDANLKIIPMGDISWEPHIVKGQEEPFIQGWYSIDYDVKEPNSTLVYTANIDHPKTFAWLLIPAPGQVPSVTTNYKETSESVFCTIGEGDSKVDIEIPLDMDPGRVKVHSH